jgi:hypothetical protein
MHPNPSIAIGRTYQLEALRHAEAARRAAEAPRSSRSRSLTLPQIRFARRVGALRTRIAHT